MLPELALNLPLLLSVALVGCLPAASSVGYSADRAVGDLDRLTLLLFWLTLECIRRLVL